MSKRATIMYINWKNNIKVNFENEMDQSNCFKMVAIFNNADVADFPISRYVCYLKY